MKVKNNLNLKILDCKLFTLLIKEKIINLKRLMCLIFKNICNTSDKWKSQCLGGLD